MLRATSPHTQILRHLQADPIAVVTYYHAQLKSIEKEGTLSYTLLTIWWESGVPAEWLPRDGVDVFLRAEMA